MKRFLLLCCCLSIYLSISAQDTIPLYPNRFSHQIQEDLAAGKLRKVRAAWEYTYIGRQQEAFQVHDYYVTDRLGFDTLTIDQIAYFRNFQPVDARDEIIRRAAQEQIILINESHIHPQHRYFTRSLLSDLRAAGFNYFGLEALSNCSSLPDTFPCDENLNKRGYPLYSKASGSYIREPQMSRLIREAHRLGFELFAYESFGDARDSMQAVYIAQILAEDPEAKILVHCGGDHNIEVPDTEVRERYQKRMGYFLKQMTGIDPFTINQYLLSETHEGMATNLYRIINLPESSVFIDKAGRLFSGWPGLEDRFDMLVYHPRTQYVMGRPVWLINEPGNCLYFPIKEMIEIDYPIIFKVWPEGDQRAAVPVDVIEQTGPEDIIPLILPGPGEYRLLMENPAGESQESTILIR